MDPFDKKIETQLQAPRWTFLSIVGVALAAAIAIDFLFAVLHPLPPRTITMATGPEGSSYAYFGKRYKELLAKDGITLILVPTAGGVENLARLHDPHSGVQIGFVEGGVAPETDEGNLASLGTLSYEPMWFFSRGVSTDRGLIALRGKRVSIGPRAVTREPSCLSF